jgi:hypothetical protein
VTASGRCYKPGKKFARQAKVVENQAPSRVGVKLVSNDGQAIFFKQTMRKIHAVAAIPVPSPRAKQNK